MTTRRPVAGCLAATFLLFGCSGENPAGPSETFTPGASYFGASQYIEYIAGNLPVIFTAPHGGSSTPGTIPDRAAGRCGGSATVARDTNTEELAREIAASFFRATGRYPHVVINRLHRRKLDANREIAEAACGVSEAETAWREFHAYVDTARARTLADFGRGWYTDLHGHGHAIARLELGYQLSAAELRLPDVELDASRAYEGKSTIRTVSELSPLTFSALLRGPSSLGALLQAEGYRSVPGSQDAAPLSGEDYFSGGYNVGRWGCAQGGLVCGVQIEMHFPGVRDSEPNRAAFSAALVRVYGRYLRENFGLDLGLGGADATWQMSLSGRR